jgi:hypothetical protein
MKRHKRSANVCSLRKKRLSEFVFAVSFLGAAQIGSAQRGRGEQKGLGKNCGSEFDQKEFWFWGFGRPGGDPGLVLQVAGIEDVTGVGFDKAGESPGLLQLVAEVPPGARAVVDGDSGGWAW